MHQIYKYKLILFIFVLFVYSFLISVNAVYALEQTDVAKISFQYNDADEGSFDVLVTSVAGQITKDTFTRQSSVENIFASQTPTIIGENTGDRLYKGKLLNSRDFIISVNSDNTVDSIYTKMCYKIIDNKITLYQFNDFQATSCQPSTTAGWVRIDGTGYPGLTATDYFSDGLQSDGTISMTNVSNLKTVVGMINGLSSINMTGRTLFNQIQSYSSSTGSALTATQLQERIGTLTCQITDALKAIYDDNSYWKSAKPSSFGALLNAVSLGTWDTAAFDFTDVGKQKLADVKGNMDTLTGYITTLKTKITPNNTNQLNITWCKFSDNAAKGTIKKYGNEDGSEPDTLNWLLKRLGVVSTALGNQTTPNTYSGSDVCGCEKLGSNIFTKGVCEALCWISQGAASFISWCIDWLIKAAGIQ
ncbi:MAG: hypothetical protein M1338_05350 [Patescibacteria group bacterium]|nr:hypothetical protein [Patescibacteria group bacterium]